MSLLNYTTGIATEKTVSEIQQLLAKHGATAVLSEFDGNGNLVILSFKLRVNDRIVGFRLPCDWRPVLRLLQDDRKVALRYCTQEQALRVAWRIIKKWIEAQMAIIDTMMVDPAEVFLPYAITTGGKTLYEHSKSETHLLPSAA